MQIWVMKHKMLTLMLVEVVALLLYAAYAVAAYSDREIVFNDDDMQVMDINRNVSPGTYLDTSYESAKAVVTPAFSLDKGIYYISASYRGNGIIKAGLIYDKIRRDVELVEGNEFYLNPQDNSVTYRVKIRDDSPIRFKIRLTGDAAGEDYVQLLNVQVSSSGLTCVYSILGGALLLVLVDLLLFGYFRYYRTLPYKQQVICAILAFIAFFSGLPLYQSGLVTGNDLTFHLQRIEGVYNGLLAGQFPVRIQPGWLDGNGYAVSVFYGDILLYFPAVLRMVGFTIQEAYKIYAEIINIVTVLISFYAFRKMTKDDVAAMTGTVLYVCGINRLAYLHLAIVGTYSAMMFYPLIVTGFYLIFTEDISNRAYKRLWMFLTVGFSGLLMTHMISCLMVGAVSFLVCLTMIKRVLRKETFVELCKAVLASILLNLWYLVPFFQYMRSEKLYINGLLTGEVISNDYYSLLASYTRGGLNLYNLFVDRDTIGSVLVLVMLIYVITIPIQKKEPFAKTSRIVFLYTMLILLVCMDFFPSVKLAKHSTLILKYFQTIQSQSRFLGVVTVMAASLGALFVAANVVKKELLYLFVGLVCCLSVYQSQQYFATITPEVVYLDSVDLYAHLHNTPYDYGIGNAEYLPLVTDTQRLSKEVQMDEMLHIIDSKRRYLSYDMTVINETNQEKSIVFPIIYYSGYKSYDLQNKAELSTDAGDNGCVEVKVPAGYEGTFRMVFRAPVVWRVTEGVSLLTFVFILYWGCRYCGMEFSIKINQRKGRE